MRVTIYGKPGEIVRARSNLHRASLAWNPPRSHVVVEDEFVRMRAEAHFVHFARMLVFQIGLDHVAREHVALEEELVRPRPLSSGPSRARTWASTTSEVTSRSLTNRILRREERPFKFS